MSEAELIFTALAELSTRQIAQMDEAVGMEENKLYLCIQGVKRSLPTKKRVESHFWGEDKSGAVASRTVALKKSLIEAL